MTYYSPEAARERYVASMGQRLGVAFYELWRECASLHAAWREFEELFGHSSERVDILNATAPGFARRIQHLLSSDVLLRICRLTDPPRSGGRANLAIQMLPGLMPPAQVAGIEALVAAALTAAGFARDWRNRRISHNDLVLATDELAEPLPPATRASISNALAEIAAVLNAVEEAHHEGGTAFALGTSDGRGATSLLFYLGEGLRAVQRESHS